MSHETVSLEPTAGDLAQGPSSSAAPQAPRGAPPLSLPFLVLSLILIAAGALALCCLAAVCALLAFYAQVGRDGVSDFYQEMRFDVPLQTQLSAAVVSALYAGVAVATLCAARLYGRRGWRVLVAWTPVRGRRREIFVLVVVALSYAAIATLAMTLPRDHRVIISGPTDLVLLGTFAANLVILAPCAEELFFRGWLYTGLRNRLTFWPSFLLTASLFAAIHWDANHRRIFLVLPLAIALGLLREATSSIKPTIALHATYNLIIVALTLWET